MNKLVLALGKLAAAFPQANATEATLAVYLEQLHKLDEATLLGVLDSLIANSSRFPTVSEIRESYNQARRDARPRDNVRLLPSGKAVPMPAFVREQLAEMEKAFDNRNRWLRSVD